MSRQDHDGPWYVIHHEMEGPRLRGPYETDDLVSALRGGSILWADFIFAPTAGQKWRRIFELSRFHSAYTSLPDATQLARIEKKVLDELEAFGGISSMPQVQRKAFAREAIELNPGQGSPSSNRRTLWYLQFDGTEFGPFVPEELAAILSSGKIRGELYAWCQSMPRWEPVADIPELAPYLPATAAAPRAAAQASPTPAQRPARPSDNRRKSRCPLMATVALVHSKQGRLPLGICSDVSPTGVQIICGDPQASFDHGETLKLEITPLGATGVRPFSVRAKVVWLKADSRKLGLTFTAIQEADRKALENYLTRSADSGRRTEKDRNVPLTGTPLKKIG